MMNRQQRIAKKRKDREKKVALKRQQEQAIRAYREKYPEFVFEDDDKADHRWVAIIRKIVKEIDFRKFSEGMRNFYEEIKADRKILRDLIKADPHPVHHALLMHMGDLIYRQVENIKNWVPYNDARVLALGKVILVKFDSLLTEKGQGGTIYYSPHKPTIQFGNKTYVVGFSTHCITQTCSRIVARPYSYAGAGDVFAFFHDCVHFEPVILNNGEPGFTFFEQCQKGFLTWNYVTHVLGEDTEDDGKYYMRLGYCPVVFEGNFVKAKTLLPAGYRETPEWKYLRQTPRRLDFEKLIQKSLGNYVTEGVARLPTDYFEPMKYFHQFIPQIVHSEKPFYRQSI
jgi:hypothetical protein